MRKWDDLRTLLSVSRNGTVSLAAQELNVSHATVSRRIADLEAELNANLVDRSSQTWLLTPLGKEVALSAKRMESEVADALNLVDSYSSDSGVVRITLPRVAIATVLAPAIQNFRDAHPKIELEFILEDEVVDLPARDADIALRFTSNPSHDLVGQHVKKICWGLYANSNLHDCISKQMRDRPNEKPTTPVILTDQGSEVPEWIKDNFSIDGARHYIYGFTEKAELAAAGLGVTALPSLVANHTGNLYRLDWAKYEMFTNLWVLSNKDARTSRRIGLLKRYLIDHL